MLLCGCVVTAAAANPQPFVILRQDFDRVVAPVSVEVSRLIGKSILTAKLILNFDEGVRHVRDLERKERASAGSVGDPLQDFVAASARAGYVGANGINNDLSPLRHVNRFFTRHVALIVIAVTEQNN